jgi:AcrR family transcriptional regulator
MRADAKKNYGHILEVAREVLVEHGTTASMRDIARRAEVGLATVLRHFPTKEALFEALLSTNLDALNRKAEVLESSDSPDEALRAWFQGWLNLIRSYEGVVALMAAAHANPGSALYASCAAVHASSARLLHLAQAKGTARIDMNGDDLFALMTALGWAADQRSFAPRADHLLRIVTDAVLTNTRVSKPQ